MALTYEERHATGPLRNMLPVDRRAPLHVAMAEWSFRPQDVHRVLGECQDYFDRHGWPNIPTEIELARVDGSLMSPWNWDGLPYVVKFNFMYLTEVCTEPGEKEEIYAHLRGLWEHLQAAGVPFKAHWGKINFIDPEFVRRNHQSRRVPAPDLPDVHERPPGRADRADLAMGDAPARSAFPGLTDIHAHPAMNAFLWDRDLRRHYWTGRTFNPLASLTDFKMLEKGGVKVLWSSLHIPEREFFGCWPDPPRGALHRRRAQAAQAERLGVPAGDDGRDGAAGRRGPTASQLARSNAELDGVLAAGKTAIVHTVEGGHVLGAGLDRGRRPRAPRAAGGARRARRGLAHPRAPLPQRPGGARRGDPRGAAQPSASARSTPAWTCRAG